MKTVAIISTLLLAKGGCAAVHCQRAGARGVPVCRGSGDYNLGRNSGT